ncbi:acyltransferase-like protein At1g54570, chloroplastic [Phoenix dactylifera]|uniref:Acyltransferase-like protein At1g54570, chloroplastic n=1 Tax=Phoenix dactylifera TaxID=42345 RepID=A0A8B8ZG34_PHODC|nr:acyltransferase-like protein At1g54570, chloroplastic [Phoenix dactylifera]
MASSLPLITLCPSLLPSRSPPLSLRRLLHRRNQWLGRGRRINASHEGLEALYDDGYRNAGSLHDYLQAVGDLLEFDQGPLRWFCPVDGGPPIKNAPLLLFLPGVDGNGLGLFMHHKALGRIFEVRCMHIPVYDRTPFKGLVKFVEDVVRFENSISQDKPIYLVGHSLGGCLALAVAAHNPDIDLILVLSNPATSFNRSQLQPLLPILRGLSSQLDIFVFYLLSINIDNQVKMALDSIGDGSHPLQTLYKLSRNHSSPLPRILVYIFSVMGDDLMEFLAEITGYSTQEAFSWKLKLLKFASYYANSHLHAVTAEVLVLASCLDRLLPSRDEAKRLLTLLLNCKVRYFEDHGHCLLLENDIHLSTIIKCTELYRRSRKHDRISDYLPPSMMELEAASKSSRDLYRSTSPVMFSTMQEGKIVRGLSGVPNDGPVLLVGNHMLMGLDMIPLCTEFLREKEIVLRGLAHHLLFQEKIESSSQEYDFFDFVSIFGAVPVSDKYFYRLLSEKAFVLLYPGGSREALHRKGEKYKLFWPVQPGFVRMAAQFGATIVPFAVVGEDDIGELLMDYDDMMSIPFVKDRIKDFNENKNIRNDDRNQDIFVPFVCPKLPGRFYYLFGKPIITSGKELLKDRQTASALYLHVKSEVERIISYLLKKREEDIYRGIIPRTLYQVTWGSDHQVPTFEP